MTTGSAPSVQVRRAEAVAPARPGAAPRVRIAPRTPSSEIAGAVLAILAVLGAWSLCLAVVAAALAAAGVVGFTAAATLGAVGAVASLGVVLGELRVSRPPRGR